MAEGDPVVIPLQLDYQQFAQAVAAGIVGVKALEQAATDAARKAEQETSAAAERARRKVSNTLTGTLREIKAAAPGVIGQLDKEFKGLARDVPIGGAALGKLSDVLGLLGTAAAAVSNPVTAVAAVVGAGAVAATAGAVAFTALGVGVLAATANARDLLEVIEPFKKEGLGIGKDDEDNLKRAQDALGAVKVVTAELTAEVASKFSPAIIDAARYAVAFGLMTADALDEAKVSGKDFVVQVATGLVPMVALLRAMAAGADIARRALGFAGIDLGPLNALDDALERADNAVKELGGKTFDNATRSVDEFFGSYLTQADKVITKQGQITDAVKETIKWIKIDFKEELAELDDSMAATVEGARLYGTLIQDTLTPLEKIEQSYNDQLLAIEALEARGLEASLAQSLRDAAYVKQLNEINTLRLDGINAAAAVQKKLDEDAKKAAEKRTQELLQSIAVAGQAVDEVLGAVYTGLELRAQSFSNTETRAQIEKLNALQREQGFLETKDAAELAALKEKAAANRAAQNEIWKQMQAMAVAQNILNAALAVGRAYADLGPIFGSIAAAGIVATTFAATAQTIKQAKPQFHTGGDPFVGGPRPSFSSGPDERTVTVTRGEIPPADAQRRAGQGATPRRIEVATYLPGGVVDRAVYDVASDPRTSTARAIRQGTGLRRSKQSVR